ncbi:MAG: hypothetical protein JWP55_5077 [Mycobacterium sp.]|nr:hypothetical protein [Mycobacterium sp.]
MQVSMFGQLSGAGTESPIDACVDNPRHERTRALLLSKDS